MHISCQSLRYRLKNSELDDTISQMTAEQKRKGHIVEKSRLGHKFIAVHGGGYVGIEGLQGYLYQRYPDAADHPLRDNYLNAIDNVCARLLTLTDEGGIITQQGAIAVSKEIDFLPEELLNQARKLQLLKLQGSTPQFGVTATDLIERLDPKNNGRKINKATTVYVLPPNFRLIGYSTPDSPGNCYVKEDGSDFFPYPLQIPMSNAVLREYGRHNIPEHPIIGGITIVRQLEQDIARIWGTGPI